MAPQSDREKLVDSYDALHDSIEQLIELLRRQKKITRKTQSQILEGMSIRETYTAIPTGGLRQSLTEAMADVEAARHEVRRIAFRLGLAEGMTIGELGRTWGFSRQLAARYAKEARGEP